MEQLVSAFVLLKWISMSAEMYSQVDKGDELSDAST